MAAAVSGSAELCQPIEQQQDDGGDGQRQQQPANGGAAARSSGYAAFFVLDLAPPGMLGALDHDPRLGGGALVARGGRRGRGAARPPAPRPVSARRARSYSTGTGPAA